MVEFEPNSLWYETSLMIAAQALRLGLPVEYHVFERRPRNAVRTFQALGVDATKLRQQDALRIIDSYTVQTGIGESETPGGSRLAPITKSVKISDWSITVGQEIKRGGEDEKGWLHIDDNTGILLQYNEEKVIIDCWRTRIIPLTKVYEGLSVFSLLAGVASAAFYKQFESLCDGVIDFNSQEKNGHIEQYVRVRFMRGRTCDSRWHRLRLQDNGEVVLCD